MTSKQVEDALANAGIAAFVFGVGYMLYDLHPGAAVAWGGVCAFGWGFLLNIANEKEHHDK